MLTYIFFLLVLFVGTYKIANSKAPNARRNALIYAGIIIVVFWGSVDAKDFGTDIMNYYNNAENALKYDYKLFRERCSFEAGYATMIWVVSNLFNSAQALLFVQYTIVTVLLFKVIYKYSNDVFLSVYTYVCIAGFAFYLYAFRQGVAMAIGIYAITKIHEKKIFKAIILILIASLFHQTSIIFLPTVFLYDRKLTKMSIMNVTVLIVVLSLFVEKFVGFGNEQFGMNYGSLKLENLSNIGGIINIVIYTGIMVLLYFQYSILKKEDESYTLDDLTPFVYIGIISIILYALRFYTLAMERVGNYFVISFAILLPRALTIKENVNTSFNKSIRIIYIVLAFILFLWRAKTSMGTYHTIWW